MMRQQYNTNKKVMDDKEIKGKESKWKQEDGKNNKK